MKKLDKAVGCCWRWLFEDSGVALRCVGGDSGGGAEVLESCDDDGAGGEESSAKRLMPHTYRSNGARAMRYQDQIFGVRA